MQSLEAARNAKGHEVLAITRPKRLYPGGFVSNQVKHDAILIVRNPHPDDFNTLALERGQIC